MEADERRRAVLGRTQWPEEGKRRRIALVSVSYPPSKCKH